MIDLVEIRIAGLELVLQHPVRRLSLASHHNELDQGMVTCLAKK